jgi:hypothetical protein
MSNIGLATAKANKDDEFYTQYKDVKDELDSYPVEYFKDKVIYCPCDNIQDLCGVPKSQFIQYFEDNKERLQYKELLHTSYQEGFDFRDLYCKKLLNKCDIVVTNPPFSLMNDFFDLLIESGKDFIFLAGASFPGYNNTFPYLQSKEIDIHFAKTQSLSFYKDISKDNKKQIGVIWVTNIESNIKKKRLILTSSYNPCKYKKYINYDAINVDNVYDIPYNYTGVMGVPITIFLYSNLEQYDILGIARNNIGKSSGCFIDLSYDDLDYYKSKNADIRPLDAFYKDANGDIIIPFTRVLIKKKS